MAKEQKQGQQVADLIIVLTWNSERQVGASLASLVPGLYKFSSENIAVIMAHRIRLVPSSEKPGLMWKHIWGLGYFFGSMVICCPAKGCIQSLLNPSHPANPTDDELI